MAASGSAAPPIDASMKRFNFLHPFGILSRGPLYDADYYSSSMANGGTTPTETPMRSRSLSNATLDARDIRKNMTHSITELFTDFRIEDPTDVSPLYVD